MCSVHELRFCYQYYINLLYTSNMQIYFNLLNITKRLPAALLQTLHVMGIIMIPHAFEIHVVAILYPLS